MCTDFVVVHLAAKLVQQQQQQHSLLAAKLVIRIYSSCFSSSSHSNPNVANAFCGRSRKKVVDEHQRTASSRCSFDFVYLISNCHWMDKKLKVMFLYLVCLQFFFCQAAVTHTAYP